MILYQHPIIGELLLCRIAALLAVIVVIKIWIENPSRPAPSSAMNSMPAQLQAML